VKIKNSKRLFFKLFQVDDDFVPENDDIPEMDMDLPPFELEKNDALEIGGHFVDDDMTMPVSKEDEKLKKRVQKDMEGFVGTLLEDCKFAKNVLVY
jgi:hypothetical protein